jgi:hypothetical protein
MPNGAGSIGRPVPVTLRDRDTGFARFLRECEIELADGAVQPIEHAGRRFLFSHTAPAGDYASATGDEIYVFTEAGPSAEGRLRARRLEDHCA